MANTSRISGFRPVKHLNGSAYNGQMNVYSVPSSDATALYVGDPVKLAAAGADATGTKPVVTLAAAGDGTPAAADINFNINHAVGTPDATMARSGATVDFGTEATTAALTFKLMGFVPREDNEVGASAKVLVKINNHQYGSSTGTAGV
jgi:hypothetical protein